jgi:hypothetical protein
MIVLYPWMDRGARDRCITSNASVADVPADVAEIFRAIPLEVRARAILEYVSHAPEGPTDPDSRQSQWVNDDVASICARGGNCIERTFAIVAFAYACGIDARAFTIAQRGPVDHMVAIVTTPRGEFVADALEPLPELRPYPTDAT